MTAAKALQRWLRRAALAAIPIAGLAGCGDQACSKPDYSSKTQVDGGVPSDWEAGSHRTGSQCKGYCWPGYDDPCYTLVLTGCTVVDQSSLSCDYHYTWCYEGRCGRVPPGLKHAAGQGQPSLVAAALADAARLEGAAVFAFQAVERDLIAHGAPAELLARARSAQRDEHRHYKTMSRLAERFGGRVPAVEVEAVGVRTLVEGATDNAAEGCIRETYGAAVAAYQGEWAQDRAVRRALRAIAADEAEHASLGWAIDAWARSRLGAGDRTRVDAAREEAREHLLARQDVPAEVGAMLGLPDAAASAHLAGALRPLWS